VGTMNISLPDELRGFVEEQLKQGYGTLRPRADPQGSSFQAGPVATQYLAAHGRAAWIAEIEGMIVDHHKITASHAHHGSLVEPFRRADWIDVTRGLRTFGLSRPLIQSLLARSPSAGFHWRLVQLILERRCRWSYCNCDVSRRDDARAPCAETLGARILYSLCRNRGTT
jgi:hypothetical protein